MSDWTITDVRRETYAPMFTSQDLKTYVRATLTHDTGAVMTVSRYDDDGRDDWGVDAAFESNGAPRWSNGEGARYLTVHTVGDADTLDALDAAASVLPGV